MVIQKGSSKNTVFRGVVPNKQYPKKLDKDQQRDKTIISDYRKRMALAIIQEKYHISRDTIYAILYRNKIPMNEKETLKDRTIKFLENCDGTTEEIAKALGVAHDSIKSNIKNWKLPREKCRCKQAFIYKKIKKK